MRYSIQLGISIRKRAADSEAVGDQRSPRVIQDKGQNGEQEWFNVSDKPPGQTSPDRLDSKGHPQPICKGHLNEGHGEKPHAEGSNPACFFASGIWTW